jgi:hypothetical protein
MGCISDSKQKSEVFCRKFSKWELRGPPIQNHSNRKFSKCPDTIPEKIKDIRNMICKGHQ